MTQPIWSLPTNLLSESIAAMRPQGVMGNEGLALWFGSTSGTRAVITYLVDVSGPGFRTTPLHMSLSLSAMAVLTDLTEKLGTCLIGQIHSHPGRFLDLSELDKNDGIRSPDYLSVVCPYYAQRDLTGFSECGVHVFEKHCYRRMSPDEILRRLIVRDERVSAIRCEVPA